MSNKAKELLSTTGEGWGIFDTQDNLWMGTTEAPFAFIEKDAAYYAALVLSDQHDFAVDRLEVRWYSNDATRMRDQLTPRRSAMSSMGRLETGVVLPRMTRMPS